MADILEILFSKDNTEDFLENHWPIKPFVHHGSPDRFHEIVDEGLTDLNQIVESPNKAVRVWLFDKNGKMFTMSVTPEHAMKLYSTGSIMLSIDNVHGRPKIDRFSELLAKDLASPVKRVHPSFYNSPVGWDTKMHFDNHENIIIQLRGKKRWKIARNENVEFPDFTHIIGWPVSPETEELYGKYPTEMPDTSLTIDMVPGSVLLVPRGWWHSTETLEESLQISVELITDNWHEVVLRYLRHWMRSSSQWREPLARTAGGWKNYVEASRTFQERIKELKAHLDTLNDENSLQHLLSPAASLEMRDQFKLNGDARVEMTGDGRLAFKNAKASEATQIQMSAKNAEALNYIVKCGKPFTMTDILKVSPSLVRTDVRVLFKYLESINLIVKS